MDTALSALITSLAKNGPGFITAAIFITFYILERKRNDKLISKLHELSLASLKADYEHTKMYSSVVKALNAVTSYDK